MHGSKMAESLEVPFSKAPLLRNTQDYETTSLPTFEWKVIVKERKIGSGSFRSVYLAKYGNPSRKVVLKKLKSLALDSKARFQKEAKILNSVKGHPNIVMFIGFCYEPHCIMMQYLSFHFGLFGLDRNVSSLADFLQVFDSELGLLSSFSDILPVCAKDILTGLNYLHNNNIAHRDLKPTNILVCNQHLHDGEVIDASILSSKAFKECPVICRLTDFGLSRGIDIQTQSIVVSNTSSIFCGTPSYMAPELKLNQITIANQEDLKRADMWSIGMVMHVMMNPELGCPYRAEAEQSGVPDCEAVVKNLLAKGRLPQHGKKYEKLRVTSWWQLEEIFNMSANFDPVARPSAARVLSIFNNHFSDSFQCIQLAMSQSTVVEQCSRDIAAKVQDNSYQSACEEGHVPLLDDATNCCAFLSIGICDRLQQVLNSGKSQNQQAWETVREVAENVICQLPALVNEHRDVSSFYDIEEAYAIMSSKNLLYQQYEFSEECVSGSKVFLCAGRNELVNSLESKASQGKMCFGIYTCSPYIFTVGIRNNALFLIDTHPVNEEFGGDGNGVLLVTPDLSYRSCQLLTQWLLLRLTQAGVKTDSRQSLVWLTGCQGRKVIYRFCA